MKTIMKMGVVCLFLIISNFTWSQNDSVPDFTWGNCSYYNLSVNEEISYGGVDIQLLQLNNQYNQFRVNSDTLWVKVSKNSLAVNGSGVRLFVADNRNVKDIADNREVHGLLTKDVLICVSDLNKEMLNSRDYLFPVSFNDGFIWHVQEDAHMFSYMGQEENGKIRSYEGIGIDMSDARGIEKHWLLAIESSTVVWVKDKGIDEMGKEAAVLLKSNANDAIYYLYNHLYCKNIEVRKGQRLMRGELIGTAWGDSNWGHAQFLVIRSDSIPAYDNRFHNSVNFFPQLYELYFKQSYSFSKSYSRGKIVFGRAAQYHRNQKNISSFEEYAGKGWKLGRWNKTNKVEYVSRGELGNARLKKVLFAGRKASSRNPKNFYEYEVNVINGVYRVRANVGDLTLPSWQKIEFEKIGSGKYELDAGEQKWTSERVVKVTDRKLTVRIYIDPENKKVAGISELVFQRAY